MAGITGRKLKAAFARSNTWGVPASVTKQLYLESTAGLDATVGMVDTESFNQTFLGTAEVGDYAALTPELGYTLRYEDIPTFLAAAMGSAANPTVVSSAAANSLVAYSHVITLADELTHFFTLAVDFNNYVLEIPTFKVRGYTVKVGDNGRMLVDFAIVGNKAVYDSTTNINSTVGGATVAALGTRVFRKDGVFRINKQSASALATGDAVTILSDAQFGATQPLADSDNVFGQNYIIEPDNDGFPEFPLTLNFARMTSASANSLAIGLKNGDIWKADWTFTGTSINATTRYSMTWRFPALQLYSFQAQAVGANQVRPQAVFRAKLASAAPSGMSALTRPFDLTIVNMNSQNLLV